MSVRTRALLLLGPLVALFVAQLWLQQIAERSFFDDSEALASLAFVVLGLVGALVVSRFRGHLEGWALWVTATLAVLVSTVDSYAVYSYRNGLDLPGALLTAWAQNWLWFAPLGSLITFCILFFPDGRLPGPRWRYLAWFAGISQGLLLLAFALSPGNLDGFPNVENPTGFVDLPSGVFFGAVIASALGCMLSLGVRFRRSRGAERQQIKWVFYAVLVMIGVNLTLPVMPIELNETASDLLFGAMTLLFPLACGIAILKHRLYDIDVVINRTLVYASLTAILGLAYLGLVVLFQEVMSFATRDSDIAIAGSTLVVAAMFRPLRGYVQAFIDQRFYRRKYDATAVVGAFSSRLRDQVNLESLTGELVSVVGFTMQPTHVSIWLRSGGRSSVEAVS